MQHSRKLQSEGLNAVAPMLVAIRPVFASSVAYVFLILFTTFFFIGFVFLYFRQFPSEVATFRRSRSRRSPPSAAAKSLPVVAHRGDGGKQAECAICLEEFGDGEAVKVIPQCGHVFHPQCIDTWLEAHVSCPVCRCSEFSGAAVKESEEVESV
uniref:RING-type E3 ubiquitin transferase n=1 Tax=Cajanus cajan TaxID=3821 RepID=A0A151QQ72_CAJCA|nr:RING-H2 finger protein ATL3B [Cajanus cajan]